MAERSPNTIADNRRARFDYEIIENYEAGVVLTGIEIKAVRAKRVDISSAYVKIISGEAWLVNMVLNYPNLENTSRSRKLLLHENQIDHLIGLNEQKGLTIVPLRAYFQRGKVKIEVGVGRGRKQHDKRELIKERDVAREVQKDLI
jgi:SsrA-binding protein